MCVNSSTDVNRPGSSSFERPIHRSATFSPADEGLQLPDITAARNVEGEVMARQMTVRREMRSSSLPSRFVPTGSHWRGLRYPPGQEPPGPTPEEQGLVCPIDPRPQSLIQVELQAQQRHDSEQRAKPGLLGQLKAKAGVSRKNIDSDEITAAEPTGFERLPLSQRPWDKGIKSLRPYEGT